MLSPVTVVLALALLLAQAPAAPVPSPDPASSVFPGTAGLMLVTIKPAATADYELAVRTLQAAMAKSADPQRQRVAKGWTVFKAAESDAKGNIVYVHVMVPAEPGFDYRISLLVDEMVQGLPTDLLSKYRDAFAAPPTKLSLTEFASMAVAPVAPDAPPPDPAAAPAAKKPGGR